jgi:hypothetical protein
LAASKNATNRIPRDTTLLLLLLRFERLRAAIYGIHARFGGG